MTSRARQNWESDEEGYLVKLFNDNVSLADIAKILGRSELAVVARLLKMEIRPAITCASVEENLARRRGDFFNGNSDGSNARDSLGPPADVQQAFSRFYFVYGIVNCWKQVYIGSSHNVWYRISQHNRNAGAQATKNRGPWYPFSIHCLASEDDARQLESVIHRDFDNYIKGYERSLRQILAQVGQPFSLSEIEKVGR